MRIERHDCGERMSRIVVHNDTVYLCGQTAQRCPEGDITAQTRDVLARASLKVEMTVIAAR